MIFMIQEILNSIDQIDDITTEYTVSTMNSMIDSYEKSTLILENYEGDDLSSFSIFQEGEIMDDVKKQGKGQSTLMKILSFIPRLIKAIFHKIKKAIGKGETPAAVNKELQKAPKEVKKALPILFDNKKDKKSKVSMIKKILIGAGTVGAAAIVGKNVMSKSKENSNDSSNAASKMTELFNKLKNVLKRKSETEKKLEEAKNENPPKTEVTPPKTMDPLQKETKQETSVNNPTSAAELKQQKKETPAKIKNVSDQDSNPPVKKVEKVTPRVSRKAPVNNNPTSVTELKQQKKESEQEIEELAEELFGLMSIHLADDELRAESQKILKELSNMGDQIASRKITELITTLDKKDAYYKDLDKEISKLIEKCESKYKSLVSIYATIKDCCHRIVDKCPVTPTSNHNRYLHLIDESVTQLESGNYTLLKISRDGEEISLTENIDNCLTYVMSNINYTVHNIRRDLKRPHNQDYKFDDSNDNFRTETLDHLTRILLNADLGSDANYATKMIIDPAKKKALSEDNTRNRHSVFDNSLVRKSDFEEIETYFTEIKGFIEEINKERPEEIKKRNIDNVMIYVSALVELAQQTFTFACRATNLVKELVGRVSEINKKYEGERNKLFNDKSE